MSDDVSRITAIICRIGKLGDLEPDRDFYDAGFSSIAALELLIELETEFCVSIPDDDFVSARTATRLSSIIARLKQEQPA